MGLLQAVVHQCVFKSGVYDVRGGRPGGAAAARSSTFKRVLFLGQPYYRCEVPEVRNYIHNSVYEAVHSFLGRARRGGPDNRVCEMVVAFLDRDDRTFTRCILRPAITSAGMESGRGGPSKTPPYESMMREMASTVFSEFTALEPKSFRRAVTDRETIAAHRFEILFYISEDVLQNREGGGEGEPVHQSKLPSRSKLVDVSESDRKKFEFEAQPELQKYRNTTLDDDAAEFLHYPIRYTSSGVFGFSGGIECARGVEEDDEEDDVLMGAA